MKNLGKNGIVVILCIGAVVACGLFSPKPQGFTVFFTVSGLLEGTSVTVDLNGAEQLTAPANGEFFFPTQVGEGTEYRVTVEERPAGQTATIKNGAGVMPAAPVTNIEVNVTTNTYTVGGTASGIPSGESITLTLNGTYNLIVNANGSFAFADKIAYRSSYAVTEVTVPTGYMLIIDNAGGTMGAGNVTNIVVTCTERTYTVGGTVQGLGSGETVSLTLNGGAPLVIAADGSFTFPDRLSDGVYTVVVSEYLGSGTVTLTNPTGLINGADVEDVSVIIATTLADVSTPTTLTPGGIYLVADGDEILVNSELNIYPGTRIIFGSNSSMRVYSGSLAAMGSETEPIIFTGKNEVGGYWKGLVFYNSNNVDNSLDHVIIEYAGSNALYYADADAPANLAVTQFGSNPCRVAISNTTMRHGAGYGFHAVPGVTVSSFTSNTCTGNALGAAHIPAALVPVFGSDSDYSGNTGGNDFVYIDAGQNPDVATAATWSDIGVPYRVGPANATLEVDAELTIDAGCEFEAELGIEIIVRNTGTLVAVGTPAAPIVFTGVTAQKGHWEGINIYQSNFTANRLSYVTVEYAGSLAMYYADVEAGVAIVTNGSASKCLIDNCTLRNNAGYGLFVDSVNADVSGFANNVITGNTAGAVSLYANNVPQLDATSTYTGNTLDQIYINVAPAIETPATWRNLGTGVTYLIGPDNDELSVNAGLTIEAGSTLRFMQGAGLVVNSSGFLTAEGESGNEIIFTGSSELAGWWKGINYYRTDFSLNRLSYAIVEYAGSAAWGYADMPANISIVTSGALYPSQASITNCHIADSAAAGIWIDAEATVNANIADPGVNTFENCAGGNIVDTR